MTVLVALEPTTLSVEPGSEAVCSVRIRNNGDIVDEFTAEAIGEIAPWVILEADSVRLFPGDEAILVLHLRPPRAHHIAPGANPFGVRVVGTSSGGKVTAVAEGSLEVKTFHDVEATIAPRRSRARVAGRHRVTVRNLGNVVTAVTLTGSDADDQLDVRFRRPHFELAPGRSRAARATVRPTTISFAPGREPHPFKVTVTPDKGAPVELEAAMVVRPVVPLWLPIALGVLAILLVLALSLFQRQNVQSLATTGALGATPSASPVAPSGSAKPSAHPNGGGGAGGGKGGAASVVATPTPQPLSSVEAGCLAGDSLSQGSRYPADGNALDAGPNHANGTLKNGATYGKGFTAAASDQAFSFAGGSSYVDLGKTIGQLGTSDFCVSLDVKTSAAADQPLVATTNAVGNGKGWAIHLNAFGQPYAQLGPSTVVGFVAVDDGAWHQVCVIRSSTLTNVYVDRKLVGTLDSSPVADISNGNTLSVGWDGHSPYTGEIDNLILVQG